MDEKIRKKSKLTLSINTEILEVAKKRIPNISQTVETMLKVLINLENADETRIVQEITKTEEELKQNHGKLLILKDRLETVRKESRYNQKEKEQDIAWYQALNTYMRAKTLNPETEAMIEKALPILGINKKTMVRVVEAVFYDRLDGDIDVMKSQSWNYIKEQYKELLE